MKEQAFYDSWDKLEKRGILDGQLINHVWRRFQPEERMHLLDIMEHFDLICPAPLDSKPHEQATGHRESARAADPIYLRKYYVPSLFNRKDVKKESDIASLPSLTFYVDFKGLFTSKD